MSEPIPTNEVNSVWSERRHGATEPLPVDYVAELLRMVEAELRAEQSCERKRAEIELGRR